MDTESTAQQTAQTFFGEYAAALLARDEQAVARLYAVPALVLFPGSAIAVGERSQTAGFFASSWAQYDGVQEADADLTVLAATDASIWADVAWSFDGEVRERFCYQLVDDAGTWRVAVLTPLDLEARPQVSMDAGVVQARGGKAPARPHWPSSQRRQRRQRARRGSA